MFDGWSPESWSALAAWATFVVAVAAAAFAWTQIRHAKEVREEQARPFVIVDLQVPSVQRREVIMSIKNIGSTVAKDVRVTFNHDLEEIIRPGKATAEMPIFKSGIPSMPPSKEIRIRFAFGDRLFREGLPLTYEATVRLRDYKGREQEPAIYVLDVSHLENLPLASDKSLDDLVDGLSEIAANLKAINASQSRIPTWTKPPSSGRGL